MTAGRLIRLVFFRLLPALVLASPGAPATAQADPPGRVGRLNHAQGPVVFAPAGDIEWTDAQGNRPLTRGDRLWTDRGSRAEIQVGSSTVRMDGQTHLEIQALDDQTAQLNVTQGTVHVRVRSLPEGENFEVDTPNLAYRAGYPGDYRIDVDGANGTTRVTIHSGTGAVYGESGQALPLGSGQQITFRARALAQLNAQEAPPQDAFDRWAAERNRQEDHVVSARYVPREVVGYQQLDGNGQWSQDPTHGAVWYPQGTVADWAPYRHGHWEWIAPWGWTWIDDAPWGFATSHYGRWAMIGPRWAWVPGRIGLRPVYAPALVAFIGDGSHWSLPIGGRPAVAWFPLAPGEAWQPPYRASPVYISNVNRAIAVQPDIVYAHQRRAEALTAISAEDFHRGRPARAGWLRVAVNLLTSAQIVPPPPMPERADVTAQQRTMPSGVTPPASAELRQVIAKPAQGRAPDAAQSASRDRDATQREEPRQRAQAKAQPDGQRTHQANEPPRIAHEQAQREQAKQAARSAPDEHTAQALQPPSPPRARPARPAQRATASAATPGAPAVAASGKRTQQAQAGPQARHGAPAARADQARRVQAIAPAERARREQRAKGAEQAKREQLAVRAEQARREQSARRAEQARRDEVTKHVAQARLEQQARRERAKRDQLASRAEQTRREDQARKAQQAKRDEQLRREAHAQRVEQARHAAERDAHALREQRVRREEQALREQREEQARRDAQEREQAQREAWQRQQQALSERWRREQQQWDQQQRDRVRARPDLRDERRPPPEIWQRGIPILNPGRTS